ncbi:MAG TPA: hypothetical protein IAA52_08495 [Candidatus Pullichristensenella stercorigallinarum]|uniref:Uncharacterized protein n=1 Tax=Candidatus Pullichristensenella stercorigallinarum TaxID=2840909 RepID=A0A9D0ZMG8_9FIRM|nr:hypothetical protein [Candidatus Pullichristensenella stercorigallinarum]
MRPIIMPFSMSTAFPAPFARVGPKELQARQQAADEKDRVVNLFQHGISVEKDAKQVQQKAQSTESCRQYKDNIMPNPALFELVYVIEQKKLPEKWYPALRLVAKDALVGDEDKFDFQIHAHEEEIQAADCEKDKEQLNLLRKRFPDQHRRSLRAFSLSSIAYASLYFKRSTMQKAPRGVWAARRFAYLSFDQTIPCANMALATFIKPAMFAPMT